MLCSFANALLSSRARIRRRRGEPAATGRAANTAQVRRAARRILSSPFHSYRDQRLDSLGSRKSLVVSSPLAPFLARGRERAYSLAPDMLRRLHGLEQASRKGHRSGGNRSVERAGPPQHARTRPCP